MATPKEKIKGIVRDYNSQNPNCAMGIINKTYESEYCCDIMVLNNNNQNLGTYYAKVPLPAIGGLTYSMPHVGDKVLVEFLGGDQSYPMITTVYPTTQYQLAGMTTLPDSFLKFLSSIS